MAKKAEKKDGGKENLQDALESLNKALGAGTAYEYKNFTGEPVKRLRTGSIGLDIATGGGWVYGLMNYISGWESSGKSTLGLYAVRNAQNKGEKCMYVDHEYSFDKTYAESLGVNVDEMILSQPDTAEHGYEVLLRLMKTGEIKVAIFDSIAAALTEREIEGDLGDSNMGVKAKLNSSSFPKLCRIAKENGVVLIMVNQLREKIGVMFGSPVTEPGGNALKFYPAIKVEARQSTKDKNEGEVTGNLVKVKCTKNKTAAPFKEAEYSIIYGQGIDRISEVIHWGEKYGIINRAGSWFSLSEDAFGDSAMKLGQGANGAKSTLEDNPELTDQIEDMIYKMAEV